MIGLVGSDPVNICGTTSLQMCEIHYSADLKRAMWYLYHQMLWKNQVALAYAHSEYAESVTLIQGCF